MSIGTLSRFPRLCGSFSSAHHLWIKVALTMDWEDSDCGWGDVRAQTTLGDDGIPCPAVIVGFTSN